MKSINLNRIPAFGVESKKVCAKRAGVQRAREHFQRSGKAEVFEPYKEHNMGKYLGYIPILGMLGGIIRCVEAHSDVKASRKDPTRKRLYKAKNQYLRGAIEISNLGLIILLPIDIGVSKARKLKLLIIKRFGYQERTFAMPEEKGALFSALGNSEKKLILRHKKVFLCDKNKISRFDIVKDHLGFGRASFKKVVDHINAHHDVYFPNPESKSTQSHYDAFNQHIDDYNAKHAFWKKASKLSSLKSTDPLPDKTELPSFPEEVLNHIISHSSHETDLAIWSQVSWACQRQTEEQRKADMKNHSYLGYPIWKVGLDSIIGGVPRIPKNMEKILDEDCPIWPGKKKKDTFFPLLIPESVNGTPFDFGNLMKFVERTFNSFIPQKLIVRHFKNQPASPGRWVLFSRKTVPNIDGLDDRCRVATVFEATIFLMAFQHVLKSKVKWDRFIQTSDSISGEPIVVGRTRQPMNGNKFHITTHPEPNWHPGVHVCIQL